MTVSKKLKPSLLQQENLKTIWKSNCREWKFSGKVKNKYVIIIVQGEIDSFSTKEHGGREKEIETRQR